MRKQKWWSSTPDPEDWVPAAPANEMAAHTGRSFNEEYEGEEEMRKDYRSIAGALRDVRENTSQTATVDAVARRIAAVLDAEGRYDTDGKRSFDRKKFLHAAGVAS